MIDCPSAPVVPFNTSNQAVPFYGNYGVNEMLLAFGTSPVVSMAAVQSPSSTYMMMDAGAYVVAPAYVTIGYSGHDITAPHGGYWYLPGTGPGSAVNGPVIATTSFTTLGQPNMPGDYAGGRHFGGVNIAFADGHVKWLQSQTVYVEAKKCTDCAYTFTTHAAQSAWNPYASN